MTTYLRERMEVASLAAICYVKEAVRSRTRSASHAPPSITSASDPLVHFFRIRIQFLSLYIFFLLCRHALSGQPSVSLSNPADFPI